MALWNVSPSKSGKLGSLEIYIFHRIALCVAFHHDAELLLHFCGE